MVSSLHTQFIFEQLVLQDKVLLEAVALAHLLVIMDDAVVEVDVGALLVLIIGCLWFLVPLQGAHQQLKGAPLHLTLTCSVATGSGNTNNVSSATEALQVFQPKRQALSFAALMVARSSAGHDGRWRGVSQTKVLAECLLELVKFL